MQVLHSSALFAGHELDLVHDDLKLAAALAVLLPGAVAQLALDGHFRALGQVRLQLLGSGAEHGAVDEVRPVLPFAGLLVLAAVVDRDAHAQHGHAALRAAQLGVARQVAANHHPVD